MANVFDGMCYKSLIDSDFFLDPRDVALMSSTDGYQIFYQKQNDCWIVLLLNVNLPPSECVKNDNLMISAMFPGPKQLKDINLFLWLLIQELKKLEGTYLFKPPGSAAICKKCANLTFIIGNIITAKKINHVPSDLFDDASIQDVNTFYINNI